MFQNRDNRGCAEASSRLPGQQGHNTADLENSAHERARILDPQRPLMLLRELVRNDQRTDAG